MLEKTIAREEIKDEDFTPHYEKMFEPQEEGKVAPVDRAGPLTFDQAIECCLRWAVFIKMIPTRLSTALNSYSDEFTMD